MYLFKNSKGTPIVTFKNVSTAITETEFTKLKAACDKLHASEVLPPPPPHEPEPPEIYFELLKLEGDKTITIDDIIELDTYDENLTIEQLKGFDCNIWYEMSAVDGSFEFFFDFFLENKHDSLYIITDENGKIKKAYFTSIAGTFHFDILHDTVDRSEAGY